MKFEIEPPKHEYELYPSEARAFRVRERPLTLEWAEKNLVLISPGYTRPGPYRAKTWQREIVNAHHYWDKIYEAGVTQVGKSLNFDIAMYYYQSVIGINGMIAYSETGTVESVFDLKIKNMIKMNPVLRKNWSGKDDDLTTSNLKLLNCIWRVASAQNPNDLATFPAAICIGSEVAKWKKMRAYNPVLMFTGRGGDYHSTAQVKLFLESSPFKINDYLYDEVHKPGCIILTPHYQCPHCLGWQEWTDYHIKLRKIDGKEQTHSPAAIREAGESAVYYECAHCKHEITEAGRAAADAHMIWAAPKIEQEDFKQTAEKILEDGSIIGRLEGGKRKGFDAVCYNFNRLVDVSYQFYKCLALFFETKNDPEAKRTYETETMARWPKRQARKVEVSFLESKKVRGFYQYGDNHRIPEDVLVLTFGGDTQKDGFYYTIFGWGYMMSCWLIRHDFIKCPIDPNQNHQIVYANFRSALYADPLRWFDGAVADWRYGLLDRGGHRPDDVDFIAKNMNNVKAYVGYPKYDDKKPAIFKSDTGPFYLGQPQMLSDFTGTLLGSSMMFFPWDTGADFFDQVWRQFFEKRINTKGEQQEVWIHGYAGDGKATSEEESGTGPDHYRDCFNLAYGAVKLAGLDKKLFNENFCESLKKNRAAPIASVSAPEPKQPKNEEVSHRADPRANRRTSGYYGRAYGRRW